MHGRGIAGTWQGMQTLKNRGSEFSSCSAAVASGHVGAMKHLMEVPMSTTALLASEDALKPCIHKMQCDLEYTLDTRQVVPGEAIDSF